MCSQRYTSIHEVCVCVCCRQLVEGQARHPGSQRGGYGRRRGHAGPEDVDETKKRDVGPGPGITEEQQVPPAACEVRDLVLEPSQHGGLSAPTHNHSRARGGGMTGCARI